MLVNFNTMPGVTAPTLEFPNLEALEPTLDPSLKLSFEGEEAPQSSFADLLKDAIGAVNAQHSKAMNMAVGFAAGQPYDSHQVMIEAAKSEAMLQIASNVTSRVAQSYQTLMNMQI
ncbi:MAG: flagellar hook-basal body complex protein FliE [Bacteroidota bacterium]